MASAVEVYMLAIADRDSILAEAANLAELVANAGKMLTQGPRSWQFGPAATAPDQPMRVDIDGPFSIDAATWPQVGQLITLQQRYLEVEDRVTRAHAALSPVERSSVQAPKPQQ